MESVMREKTHIAAIDQAEARSEASTEIGKLSEVCISETASSHGGDTSPRGNIVNGGKKLVSLPIARPRWSDMSDGLLNGFDDDEDAFPESPDASPKSPSKSTRRANRRRRRREEARAAALEASTSCAEDTNQQRVPCQAGNANFSVVATSPGGKLMLPAAAFVDPRMVQMVPVGNCTPTCIASPSGPSVMLPSAAFTRGGLMVPEHMAQMNAGASSPCKDSQGQSTLRTTAPNGIMGDASMRSPSGVAVGSPCVRGVILGTEASTRTPTAGVRTSAAPTVGPWPSFAPNVAWAVVGSPCARGGIPSHGIVSTSPAASACPAASPASSSSCGPAGSAAADAMRTLLGQVDLPSGADLEAKLRAAAPETYED
mmetsp:Transcript_40724/g.103549  ORF Transcript_40724/g.103549 Transcript_40724/m.103549 type:complete len:371 (+) Transcript_40724:70-1182(+)